MFVYFLYPLLVPLLHGTSSCLLIPLIPGMTESNIHEHFFSGNMN
jgi:hypothetical protein